MTALRARAVLLSVVVLSVTVLPVAVSGPAAAAGNVTVEGGTADPDTVSPGTTVNNQKVYAVVDNVSADGDTDTFYFEFPNDLSSGLSPNYANANDTSITSSVTLVDGYDNDGVDETLKFSTSATGGGAISLNVSVDTSVDYPDKEDIHDVDFRVVDSSNGTATQSAVASIQAGSPPSITDYNVSNPSGRTVNVSFNASEELSDIGVELTDGSGDAVATMTEGDFTETNVSGTWVYEGSYTASQDGQYTATLATAEDTAGIDGASGESGTVRLNTVGVDIVDGVADPSSVANNTTVNNQQVTVTLANVSADGDTDTHFVEFPNALADGLSANQAKVNGSASIAQSAQLVEGYDNDGTDETVRFQTDDDSGGVVSLNVTVDVSVDYPDAETTYLIDARTEDSDGDVAGQSGVASITADSPACICQFDVDNPSGQVVEVTFNASERLSDIAVDIADSDGGTVATLTESDFSATEEGSTWVYEGTYTVSQDGTYDVTLTTAVDDDGTPSADGETASITVEQTVSDGSSDDSGGDSGGDSSISDLSVATSDHEVDIVVTADSNVEEFRVHVTGAVETTLTADEFDVTERAGEYVYVANVSSDSAGSIEATLEYPDGAAELTESTTVTVPDAVDAGAVAVPSWVGESGSTHTFVVPVTDSAVEGRTLETVRIDYREAFLAEGGSVSSVSDDRNVATLRVVRQDGTVESELSGTDAVTVDASSGTVRLDLSDVDSSRIPTLDAGDRVVVRIRPVTNPDAAGDYGVGVALETPLGIDYTVGTTVPVRRPSAVDAVATEVVLPDDNRTSMALSRSDDITSVTVGTGAHSSGVVRAAVPNERPRAVDSLSQDVVTTVRLTRPKFVHDDPANVSIGLSTTAVEVDAEHLALVRYNASADHWERLGPDVTARSDDGIVLTAATTRNSLFAVISTAASDDEGSTPTATETNDNFSTHDTVTATEQATESRADGFGVSLALVSLLAGALVALRRRR